jgi:CubicO group peptidase (beta-lactamase class C family)
MSGRRVSVTPGAPISNPAAPTLRRMTMHRDHVTTGFEGFRAAFVQIVADGTPAALHGRQDGRVVIDLAAGHDRVGRPVTTDTPVFLYSAVKPFAALAVLLAVADGEVDLDAPVARDWPAFAARGKGRVTVRELLAHGAAVPGWREPLTLAAYADRVAAAELLAAAEPWWEPGEPGEHALSYGHLVDAVLRTATGRDVEDWWPEVVAATGVNITLTADARDVAPLDDPGGHWHRERSTVPGLMGDLLRNPPDLLDVAVVNSPAGRALVAPAVTGYASAADLSALWAWWTGAGGARRLGAGLRDESLSPQVAGRDHVLDRDVVWGLGPQIDDVSIGMGGVGGCVGWYERGPGLALGFTTPRVGSMDRLDPLDAVLEAG